MTQQQLHADDVFGDGAVRYSCDGEKMDSYSTETSSPPSTAVAIRGEGCNRSGGGGSSRPW